MIEMWIKTNNKPIRENIIIEISTFGRLKLVDGTIEYSKLRQTVKFNGKIKRVYRIIAENFLPNPENKPCVDHRTHNPKDMNVNDIRNLRWCTRQENNRFPEGVENKRNAKLGTHPTDATRKKMSESGKIRWMKYRENKKTQE